MFGLLFNKTSDEEQMLRKARNGDNVALERLYSQNVRYLTAMCSRYLCNDEDIKDVLQESFIKIFSSLDDFEYRGRGSLKAWMGRITLNETLKHIKANSRLDIVDMKGEKFEASDDDLITDQIPSEVLHRFIQELPDGYRTVFNLYVIDDKSHKEIAQILGIKQSTSASQLHKAKAMLARKIKQYLNSNSI